VVAFRIQKKHWVNIPIWDEWDTPGNALLHYFQRTLTWADLISQHNESRKVIPRLIHIAIASVAGWDVRQGMVLTLLSACATSVCALVYLKKRESLTIRPLVAWLFINLLLFAPSQYENFLSGFVFEIFIPFLCLFACCKINLSGWRLPWKTLGTSGLAILSTYTFAHGMLLWIFAVPIPNQTEWARSGRWRFLFFNHLLYFGLGGIAIAYYFVGYYRPEVAPPLPTLSQFPEVVEFLVVWLGAVWRSPFVDAHVAGALASVLIFLTLALALLSLRANKQRWRDYYPWFALLGFSLGSGLLTAVGRVTLGIDLVFNTWFDGFSSMKYNATAAFAYVGVIGLLFHAWSHWVRYQARLKNAALVILSSGCTLLAVAWTHLFSEEKSRVELFQENRRRALAAIAWIRFFPNNPEIFHAYPYPEGFWRRALEMQRLGIIKVPMANNDIYNQVSALPRAADFDGGSLDRAQAESGGKFRFVGWARNPENNRRADYVVLGWEGGDSFHPFTALLTGASRLDVVRVFNAGSLWRCGFDAEIDLQKLPPEAEIIKGWAVDFVAKKAFPLGGAVRLERPVH
jgi:hypothetical protein